MGKLVDVMLTTSLGAEYRFPDVDESVAEDFAKSFRPFAGTITLTNVSNACLVLPSRIVATIKVGGQVKWTTVSAA